MTWCCAARLQAGGDVVFDGAAASGAVIMAGARIGGMLSLAGAAVSANSCGNALNCNGTRIGRDIALNTIRGQQAFTVSGGLATADVREFAGDLGIHLDSWAGVVADGQ